MKLERRTIKVQDAVKVLKAFDGEYFDGVMRTLAIDIEGENVRRGISQKACRLTQRAE